MKIDKIISFLLLFYSLTFFNDNALYGQVNDSLITHIQPLQVRWHLLTGLNISEATYYNDINNDANTSSIQSIVLGGGVTLSRKNKPVSTAISFVYLKKGLNVIESAHFEEAKISIPQLELSIRPQYNFSEHVYLSLGAYISKLINVNYEQPRARRDSLRNFYSSFDYGGGIGLGLKFIKKMNVEILYNRGGLNMHRGKGFFEHVSEDLRLVVKYEL